MAEEKTRTAFGGILNLLTIEPGTKVRLIGGETAEVVENPGDGMWLRCRYLTADDAGLVGEEEPIFANDVVGLAE